MIKDTAKKVGRYRSNHPLEESNGQWYFDSGHIYTCSECKAKIDGSIFAIFIVNKKEIHKCEDCVLNNSTQEQPKPTPELPPKPESIKQPDWIIRKYGLRGISCYFCGPVKCQHIERAK